MLRGIEAFFNQTRSTSKTSASLPKGPWLAMILSHISHLQRIKGRNITTPTTDWQDQYKKQDQEQDMSIINKTES